MNKLTTSLAALILATSLTHAGNSDLFLGFQQTGVTTNIEFDLGKISSFLNDAAGSVTDLSSKFSLSPLSIYTPNSATNGPVYFGLVGTNGDANNTVFVGSPATVPLRQNNQAGLESSVQGIPQGYTNNIVSNYASIGTSDPNSYTTVAGADGTYQGNFLFQTQAAFTGSGTQLLELYQVSQGTGPATLLGTLSLNDTTGALSYTALATPEPSTYLMMGMGLAVLAVAARRRLANDA